MIAQKNMVNCRNDIFQMSAGRCYPGIRYQAEWRKSYADLYADQRIQRKRLCDES